MPFWHVDDIMLDPYFHGKHHTMAQMVSIMSTASLLSTEMTSNNLIRLDQLQSHTGLNKYNLIIINIGGAVVAQWQASRMGITFFCYFYTAPFHQACDLADHISTDISSRFAYPLPMQSTCKTGFGVSPSLVYTCVSGQLYLADTVNSDATAGTVPGVIGTHLPAPLPLQDGDMGWGSYMA